jgi:hypothetical protein
MRVEVWGGNDDQSKVPAQQPEQKTPSTLKNEWRLLAVYPEQSVGKDDTICLKEVRQQGLCFCRLNRYRNSINQSL